MFTGIIEEVGKVQSFNQGQIYVEANKILEGTKIGDSIATNGICLTVTSIQGSTFTADVMPESIRRTSLEKIQSGDVVNLERAMPCDGRFGGHIVSGHIDGTGRIISIVREANAIWYSIQADTTILRYIVEKGSITIDGISLTVAYVDESLFKVSIIPHTASLTNLSHKRVGDLVNLENDVIAKYIEKLIGRKEESTLTLEAFKDYEF